MRRHDEGIGHGGGRIWSDLRWETVSSSRVKQDPDLSIGTEGRGCLAVDTALHEIGCEETPPLHPIQSPTKRPLNPMDRSV